MADAQLSATQQIELTARQQRESQKRHERIRDIMAAVDETADTCGPDAHRAVVDLAKLGIEFTGDCHADIKDIRNIDIHGLREEMAAGMGTLEEGITGIRAVLDARQGNGRAVIPIPLKNGKTLPVPAGALVNAVLGTLGLILITFLILAMNNKMGTLVEVYGEWKAIHDGTAEMTREARIPGPGPAGG